MLRTASVLRNIPSLSSSSSPLSALVSRNFFSYANEPTHPIPGKEPKRMTAAEAVSVVKSGIFTFFKISNNNSIFNELLLFFLIIAIRSVCYCNYRQSINLGTNQNNCFHLLLFIHTFETLQCLMFAFGFL